MTLPARALEADLGDRIVTLYAHINAATCELLRLIARFDAKQHAARRASSPRRTGSATAAASASTRPGKRSASPRP